MKVNLSCVSLMLWSLNPQSSGPEAQTGTETLRVQTEPSQHLVSTFLWLVSHQFIKCNGYKKKKGIILICELCSIICCSIFLYASSPQSSDCALIWVFTSCHQVIKTIMQLHEIWVQIRTSNVAITPNVDKIIF